MVPASRAGGPLESKASALERAKAGALDSKRGECGPLVRLHSNGSDAKAGECRAGAPRPAPDAERPHLLPRGSVGARKMVHQEVKQIHEEMLVASLSLSLS